VNRFGHVLPVNPREPVQHVCFYEAEAFARWCGKRLPTEAEWEKAASWDPALQKKRLFPWGDESPTPELANLDHQSFGPMEIGAYPAGVSPYGCHQMIGDVWEWVASEFRGHPGFQAWPYREYSEVFFGDEYRMLRGGSWATRPGVIRNTFRNWDYPIRRQIFSGFRCARDAA
jgi:iron(II)-dependent oxidoreductase